jgi:hypothetical protein
LKSVLKIAMMWMQRDDCVDGVVDDVISSDADREDIYIIEGGQSERLY